ncbi:putative receptor like protein 25 [Eucalyptus grandis]|uniref:putative receptor like protein 25 n=1 Tax=Eucalyptus grandis TaxID=71139 RepID=UPI00192ED893|nr:putative receptor like protein 25 [Eucalyptus grandis]
MKLLGMEFSDTPTFLTNSEVHIYYSGSLELNMKGRPMEYFELIPLVKMIDLSRNKLSGEIPPEISNLSALKTLNLSNNKLMGSIPGKISRLKQLETLDLSFNRLSGQIPPGMSSMTFLNSLNLSYNNLDGEILEATSSLHSIHPALREIQASVGFRCHEIARLRRGWMHKIRTTKIKEMRKMITENYGSTQASY